MDKYSQIPKEVRKEVEEIYKKQEADGWANRTPYLEFDYYDEDTKTIHSKIATFQCGALSKKQIDIKPKIKDYAIMLLLVIMGMFVVFSIMWTVGSGIEDFGNWLTV